MKEFYKPNPNPDRKIADRKTRFEGLNAFISRRNGWVTSVPGAREVIFEALPDSPLPAELGELGYELREEGEGQRILAGSIVEKFTRRADGELEPLIEGSTRAVVHTVQHAGIVKVKRYAFDIA